MAMSAGTAVGYLTLDVSNFVSGLGRAMSSASSAFNSMSSTAESKTRALGTTLASAGTMLTAGVTAPIISLGKSVIETGATFDATMDQVAAVSRKPGQSLIELKQDTQMLREEAIRLGSSTFFSAQEVADGMVIMSKAGWDAQDIMDGMGGVLDSASASGENLSTVSTVLVDSLTAFGLSASHATDIADLFTQSANAGTLDIKDLGQSMKYAGPVASALGMSVTDTTAAITMMSKAGIKGSQAGTSLRRILLNMTAPTKKQAEAMERLGISIDDGTGHFKSLQQILRDVRSGVKNFDGSTVELQANLQKLAGAYGISGLNAILNLSDQEFEQIIHDMEYSGGVAKDTAQIMRDNVAGAWDEFNDKVEAAKLKVFDAIAPALQELLGHINNFMDGLNNKLTPQMGQFIVKIAAAAAAIGPLMTAFGGLAVIDSKINGPLTNVIRTIGNLRGGFAKLVPDISSATSGIGAVMRSVGNNITNIVPITRAATKGAVSNFREMAAGFTSNAKTVMNVPNRIGRSFQALSRIIHGSFQTPMQYMRNIGKDTATTMELIEGRVRTLQPTFKTAFGTAKEAASDAWSTITKGLDRTLTYHNSIFLESIGEGWKRAFSGGGPILQSIGNFGKSFATFFAKLPSTIKKDATGLFNVYKEALSESRFSEIAGGIKKGVSSAVSSLGNIIKGSASFIKTSYSDAFKYMGEGFQQNFPKITAGFNTLKAWFAQSWDSMGKYGVQTLQTTFSSARGIITQAFGQISSTLIPQMSRITALFSEVAGGLSAKFGPAFTTISNMAGQSFGLIANAGKLAFGVTIVGAIAAVIAAFAHLMSTSDGFRESVMQAASRVSEAFTSIGGGFSMLMEYLAPIGQAFANAFNSFTIEVAPLLLTIINAIADGLVSLASGGSNVGSVFEGIAVVVQSLLPVFQDVLNFAADGLRVIADLVSGNFTGAWESAKEMVGDFGNIVSDLANLVEGVLDAALNGLAGILRDLGFDAAADQIQNFANNFNIVGTVVDFFKQKLSEWGQQLGEVFSRVAQGAQDFGNRIGPALQTILPILAAIAGVVGGVFLAAFTAAFSTIGNLVVTAANTIANALNGVGRVISGIANVIAGVWNVVSNVVMAIVSLFTGDLQGAADHLGAAFEGFGQIAGGVFDALGGAAETLGSIIEGVFGGIGNVVGGVADFIGGAVNNVVGFFTQGGAAAEDMSGKVSSSAENMAGSYESFVDRHGKAVQSAMADEDRFGSKVTETVEQSTEKLNGLVGATDSAANGINGGTNKAVEAFRGLAEKGGSYLEQLGLSADASDSDIESALNSMAGATEGYTGDISSAFGDTGMDISSFASGVEGDTGVATASFEEMGAAIDDFGNKSQEAAETVSTAFQSVSDSITNALTGATDQFTQFGTSSSETFTSITETVNNFVTTSQASFDTFKLNTSTVFDALLVAVQNFSSQASVSLDSFVTSISTSFSNAQISVVNFTMIAAAALQQFNTSATAALSGLATEIGNAFLSLTAQVLASFQSLTGGISAQLAAAQAAVAGWVAAVTTSIAQVVVAVTNMAAQLNAIASGWGAQFTASIRATMTTVVAVVSANLNQMVAMMTARTTQMLSVVTSNFTAMSSRITAATNHMSSTITAFGTRSAAQVTSACTRMNSIVSSQFTAMSNRVSSATNQMVSVIQNFGNRMVTVGNHSMTQYRTTIQRGFEQTRVTITNASNQMVSILTQLVSRFAQQGTAAANSYKSALTGGLSGLYGQLYSIGAYAIQGMAAGIYSGTSSVVGAIRSVAAQAVSAAQAALKISSPSKVMRDKVGVWIPAGIAQGIENNSKALFNAYSDMVMGLIDISRDAGRDWADEGKAQVKKFSETIKQTLKSEQDRLDRAWKLHYEHELKVIEDEETDLNKKISEIKEALRSEASKEEIEQATQAQNDRLAVLKEQKEELKNTYKTFGTEVMQVFEEAMSSVSEGVSEELSNKFQTIADSAAKTLEDVQKKMESMTSKLQGYGDLFTIEKDKKKDIEIFKLSDLQEQINAITRYGQNLEALKGKISETLLSEIVAMDVDKANQYTDYLLHMSDEALEQYNKLYEEKQRKAADIATKFYQDKVQQIKDDYLKQLVDAFLASYDQIDGASAQLVNKLHELIKNQDWSEDSAALLEVLTPMLPTVVDGAVKEASNGLQEFTRVEHTYRETTKKAIKSDVEELVDDVTETVGNAVGGIYSSIANGSFVENIFGAVSGALASLMGNVGDGMNNALTEEADKAGADFSQTLINQVKDKLGIHSPSKVFESIGEDTSAGFVQGFAKFLSSSSLFEQFAEMAQKGLDTIIEQLSVAGSEHILPTVITIADEIKDYIQQLVDGVLALNNKLIREFESTFNAFDTFIKSVASSVSGSANSIISSYNRMASAARSAAAAAREAAAAFEQQAAAQSEANRVQAEANRLAAAASASSSGSKLTTQSVTNNYSTVINSPVKVSAIEAMRTSARVQRSLAEGY